MAQHVGAAVVAVAAAAGVVVDMAVGVVAVVEATVAAVGASDAAACGVAAWGAAAGAATAFVGASGVADQAAFAVVATTFAAASAAHAAAIAAADSQQRQRSHSQAVPLAEEAGSNVVVADDALAVADAADAAAAVAAAVAACRQCAERAVAAGTTIAHTIGGTEQAVAGRLLADRDTGACDVELHVLAREAQSHRQVVVGSRWRAWLRAPGAWDGHSRAGTVAQPCAARAARCRDKHGHRRRAEGAALGTRAAAVGAQTWARVQTCWDRRSAAARGGSGGAALAKRRGILGCWGETWT